MTRRHGVGAPDRGLLEQARRNERGSGDPFLPRQKPERYQAERQRAKRQRHRAQLHALHLFEPRMTGPMNKMNSSRPGESNVVRRQSPSRGGMRKTNNVASRPSGMLIRKIDCQPKAWVR